jgi:hypothetical protein
MAQQPPRAYRWLGVSIPPGDLPRSPTRRVPQWVLDEAAGRNPVWTPDGLPSAAPLGIAEPARYARPGHTHARWKYLSLIVVAVLSLVPVVQWLAQYRPVDLGPDYSGVVLSRSASELPPAVETNRRSPAAGFEETGAPLGTASVVAAPSTSYRFLSTELTAAEGTVPDTWSPCRPIHFVVYTRGAPKGFVDQVVAAMGALSVATGLVFVNDGLTDERPSADRNSYQPTRYGDRWAPVIIGFADEATYPGLKGSVVGRGGPQPIRESRTGTYRYVSGTVVLDTTLLLQRDQGGVPVYVQVLRHELGHLIGLDHVNDETQLMNPTTGDAFTYQAGDLAGLAKLGQGFCAPDL